MSAATLDIAPLPASRSVATVDDGSSLEAVMRIYKWVTLGAAIVIIALEAFLFTRANTDDIAPAATTATTGVITPGSGATR
jgi:hypothetical protein